MPLAPRSYTLEYPYTRRCRGKLICPPIEFDPESGETLAHDFLQQLAMSGVVDHRA